MGDLEGGEGSGPKSEEEVRRRLLKLGLDMVERGAPGISEGEIDVWMSSEEELPFQKAVSGD